MEGDALLPKPRMAEPRLVSAQRYLVGVTLLLIVVLVGENNFSRRRS